MNGNFCLKLPFFAEEKKNTWHKLKNADKKKGPNLVCGSDKIEISFEMAELDAMKLGTEK